MILTLQSLRDLGNTVVVVEHDEDTIRAADHIVEMDHGPGIHGGSVVVEGSLKQVLSTKASPTGQYLSGKKSITTPESRRAPNGQALSIRGARHNNLKGVDVDIPLGQFVCISGASGSGKSSLVNEVLYKRLWKELVDGRTIAGEHDAIEGLEHVTRVINIDHSHPSAATAARIPPPIPASTTTSAPSSPKPRSPKNAATNRVASPST